MPSGGWEPLGLCAPVPGRLKTPRSLPLSLVLRTPHREGRALSALVSCKANSRVRRQLPLTCCAVTLAAAVIGKCGRTASQTAALNTNRAGGREQKEKSAIRWLGASEALCPGAGAAETPRSLPLSLVLRTPHREGRALLALIRPSVLACISESCSELVCW